jgi:hypothetical protein
LDDIPGAYTYILQGSQLIYMNGSTDYLEIKMFATNSTTLITNATRTFFQGFLARGA